MANTGDAVHPDSDALLTVTSGGEQGSEQDRNEGPRGVLADNDEYNRALLDRAKERDRVLTCPVKRRRRWYDLSRFVFSHCLVGRCPNRAVTPALPPEIGKEFR
jgi:hypothetical protein